MYIIYFITLFYTPHHDLYLSISLSLYFPPLYIANLSFHFTSPQTPLGVRIFLGPSLSFLFLTFVLKMERNQSRRQIAVTRQSLFDQVLFSLAIALFPFFKFALCFPFLNIILKLILTLILVNAYA